MKRLLLPIVLFLCFTGSVNAQSFPDENGKSYTDLNYVDWCVKQTADAVNEAVKNLDPPHSKFRSGKHPRKIG